MAELARSHAVHNQQRQAQRQAQSHAQRVKGTATVLVALVFHQEVKTAAEAGNEADHEYDNQYFQQNGLHPRYLHRV